MIDLMVVLQNAWFYDGKPRRRSLWLIALWRSYTGKNLKRMLPNGITIEITEASSQISNHSSAVFPPEPDYIRGEYEKYNPRYILACGRIAQRGCQLAGLDFIPAPHPAWRALTNAQIDAIRRQLADVLEAEDASE